jgi:hypothetical protein
MWVLIVVLALVLLTLAGFGIAMLVSGGDNDTGGVSTPESSTSVGGGDNDGGAGAGAQPGNAPGPNHDETAPSKPGEFVEVDDRKYIGRPASYAAESLSRDGLVPVIVAQGGQEPEDADNCTVIKIDADRPVLVGTEVPIYCNEGEGPSR